MNNPNAAKPRVAPNSTSLVARQHRLTMQRDRSIRELLKRNAHQMTREDARTLEFVCARGLAALTEIQRTWCMQMVEKLGLTLPPVIVHHERPEEDRGGVSPLRYRLPLAPPRKGQRVPFREGSE